MPLQRKSDGSHWPAGNSVWGLCAAHNHATDPGAYLSDHEHKRTWQYARAIRARMRRLSLHEGEHYRELESGTLWPIKA